MACMTHICPKCGDVVFNNEPVIFCPCCPGVEMDPYYDEEL